MTSDQADISDCNIPFLAKRRMRDEKRHSWIGKRSSTMQPKTSAIYSEELTSTPREKLCKA